MSVKPFRLERREIRSLADFIWGYHHRSYLLHCFETCALALHVRRERCRYRNVNKFIKRESEWLGGLRCVPAIYLEVIGCDLEILKTAVVHDQEEYDRALQFTLHPHEFVVRLMSAVYTPHELPPDCTLEQAKAEIAAFQKAHPNLLCCINWPGLRAMYFENGELTKEVFYRPKYVETREGISFGDNGQGVGETRL